jgi:hypothetical protein
MTATSSSSQSLSSRSSAPLSPGEPLPVTTEESSKTAISTKTVNGSTVIVYRGQEFPVGPTKGKVSVKRETLEGEDYAAAFDDKRVIWENVPGAAKQLKRAR